MTSARGGTTARPRKRGTTYGGVVVYVVSPSGGLSPSQGRPRKRGTIMSCVMGSPFIKRRFVFDSYAYRVGKRIHGACAE